MKLVHKHRSEKWYENTPFMIVWALSALVIISLLVTLITQSYGVKHIQATRKAEGIQHIATFNSSNAVGIEEVIQIVSNTETDRQYEKIKTHLFEVVNTESNKVLKLTEAVIPIESIEKAMDEYLTTSKYKTLSIGVVDNKFYIQQDTSVIENRQLKTEIISIMDEFTADSWFKLTEAIYNSSDVQASSLFSYQTENGNKHLIYIFAEK